MQKYLYMMAFLQLSLSNTYSSDYPLPLPQELQHISLESDILQRTIEIDYYKGSTCDVVYITDGQKMIDNGAWDKIYSLVNDGLIKDASFVFVSTIDKESGIDYRDEYFFCSEDYRSFVESELIPYVEANLEVKYTAADRSILGISFGGLNAAYLMTSDLFINYGILSPITYPCADLLSKIVFNDLSQKRVILTTGQNDAEIYLKPLAAFLEPKCIDFHKIQTEGGHDFDTWVGQMQDVLDFLLK